MKLAIWICFSVLSVQAQTYWATTIAGANHAASGPALNLPFTDIAAMATDSAGNLYVADRVENRVRQISPQGFSRVFAGPGGPASTTQVLANGGIAIDANDNVYIAGIQQVWRVTQSGDTVNYAGLVCPTCSAWQFAPDGGPATQQIMYPTELAVDSFGNLFANDIQGVIRKVDAHGNMSIVAGTLDAHGYAGDGGPATSALFGNQVSGIATDPTGNLYIADTDNGRIRELTTDGMIHTLAGTGSYSTAPVPDNTPFNSANIFPVNMAYFNGALYVTDYYNDRFMLLNLAQSTVTNLPINAEIGPIALDPQGHVFYALYALVTRIDLNANSYSFYAGQLKSDSGRAALDAFLVEPRGVALDGSDIWVADYGNQQARWISPQLHINGLAPFGLDYPGDLAADGRGDLFIGYNNAQIYELAKGSSQQVLIAGIPNGSYSGDGGPALDAGIGALAFTSDQSGNLYICDLGRIRKIEASTGIISTIAGNGTQNNSGDGGPALQAELSCNDIAVDGESNIYIVGLNRVRKINTQGVIATIAGDGDTGFSGDGGPAVAAEFNNPNAIAVDTAGNVFVGDGGNCRLREVTPDGIIHTIAGTGVAELWTPDGDALDASLCAAHMTVDGYDNLYISDGPNDRVLRISPVIPGGGLIIDGGAGQTAPAHEPLPQPLAVQVTDASGKGIEGVPITFTVADASSATFDPAWELTDAEGKAATNVELGFKPGTFSVTATAPGLRPVVFQVTATRRERTNR